MYRLILTDPDGILLSGKKTISNHTLSIPNRCLQAGMYIGFSTASSECNAQQFIEIVRPDTVISCDGALTRFKGVVVHEHAFSCEKTRAQLEPGLSLRCEVTADIRSGHYRNCAAGPCISMPYWEMILAISAR